MTAFPFVPVAPFVFGLAPQNMFISEMRPFALLLHLKLIINRLNLRGFRLSAENHKAQRGGD